MSVQGIEEPKGAPPLFLDLHLGERQWTVVIVPWCILTVKPHRHGEPFGFAPPLDRVRFEVPSRDPNAQKYECQDVVDGARWLVAARRLGEDMRGFPVVLDLQTACLIISWSDYVLRG